MDPRRAWALTRYALTALSLFGAWLLFAGRFDPFSLIVGAAGSLGLAGLTYPVFLAEHEAGLRSFFPRMGGLLAFAGRLVVDLYRSSARMLGAVVSGRASPRIVHIRTRLGSDLARMVLANSLTLTPGTLTLDLNEDHLLVYWFFCTTTHSRAAGEAVKGPLEEALGQVWT